MLTFAAPDYNPKVNFDPPDFFSEETLLLLFYDSKPLPAPALYEMIMQTPIATLVDRFSIAPDQLFDFLKNAWADLSHEDKAFSGKSFDFFASVGLKTLDRFIEQNINFYELHYDLICVFEHDLREIKYLLEDVRELNDISARNAGESSPPHIDYEEFDENFADLLPHKTLGEISTIFRDYQRQHQHARTDPNDPVARLANCLTRAHRQSADTNVNLHDFNWAKHMSLILAHRSQGGGYRFKNTADLRKFEEKLRDAEIAFYKLKDQMSAVLKLEFDDPDDRVTVQQSRAHLAKLFSQAALLLPQLSLEQTGDCPGCPYTARNLMSSWYYDDRNL